MLVLSQFLSMQLPTVLIPVSFFVSCNSLDPKLDFTLPLLFHSIKLLARPRSLARSVWPSLSGSVRTKRQLRRLSKIRSISCQFLPLLCNLCLYFDPSLVKLDRFRSLDGVALLFFCTSNVDSDEATVNFQSRQVCAWLLSVVLLSTTLTLTFSIFAGLFFPLLHFR